MVRAIEPENGVRESNREGQGLVCSKSWGARDRMVRLPATNDLLRHEENYLLAVSHGVSERCSRCTAGVEVSHFSCLDDAKQYSASTRHARENNGFSKNIREGLPCEGGLVRGFRNSQDRDQDNEVGCPRCPPPSDCWLRSKTLLGMLGWMIHTSAIAAPTPAFASMSNWCSRCEAPPAPDGPAFDVRDRDMACDVLDDGSSERVSSAHIVFAR